LSQQDTGRRLARGDRSLAWVLAAGGLAVASLALLTRCTLAPAPPPVPRIGVLQPNGPAGAASLALLRQGLRAQGLVDGQTILLEDPAGQAADVPLGTLAAALVESRVDVIVTIGSAAAQAAKAATASIPIVAVGVTSDPVAMGLVASLGRPGGNLTGVRVNLPELSSKQLELLTEALPGTRRVAVLGNAGNPAHQGALRQLDATAGTLGVDLQLLDVRAPDDLAPAFAAARTQRADALIVLHDPLTFAHRERILALAAQSRLPAMYDFREWADGGGMFSYGPSLPDAYRRAALYVDRILRGARPEDLPIVQPTRFELVVNLRTTATLGLSIPRAVLADATDVIQ
jgi:putative tryptophan/tyrosine transport system substrate-binding protein